MDLLLKSCKTNNEKLLPPIKMPIIWETDQTTCWGGCGQEEFSFFFFLVAAKVLQPLWRQLPVSNTVKCNLTV